MSRATPKRETQLGNVGMPYDAVWLSDRGLWIGGDLLVDHGLSRKSLAPLEVMLAIAFRKRLPSHVRCAVEAAIDDSRRGDQGLANLRLAMTKHTRIADAHSWPVRRAAAERRLANGLTTNELLREVDRDEASDSDLVKFDRGEGAWVQQFAELSGGVRQRHR